MKRGIILSFFTIIWCLLVLPGNSTLAATGLYMDWHKESIKVSTNHVRSVSPTPDGGFIVGGTLHEGGFSTQSTA